MGREAVARAEAGTEAGEVKALLESTELILRGAIRRRFPREAISDPRAEGELLRFACNGEEVRLHLGSKAALSWARAIATPPPDLRHKLGLKPGTLAFMIGPAEDAALVEALSGRLAASPDEAQMLVARIDAPEELQQVLALNPALPIWAVYPKGKPAYGDAAIRRDLREAGYRDTKSCAVSDRLTATRYDPA